MTRKPTVDMCLIARQQRQLLTQMSTVRDDMGVMMAILQRLDGIGVGLVNEIRANASAAFSSGGARGHARSGD